MSRLWSDAMNPRDIRRPWQEQRVRLARRYNNVGDRDGHFVNGLLVEWLPRSEHRAEACRQRARRG